MNYHTIIIGSGPSAIAAARRLKELGIKFIMLDKGTVKRNPRKRHDISNGFGGAALKSDGKLSGKPSGTKVFELNDKALIRKALEELLNTMDIANKGVFLDRLDEEETFDGSVENKWLYKEYPSVYISVETRVKIMNEAYELLKEHYMENVVVYKVTKHEDEYTVWYQENNDFVTKHKFTCSNIICAGGRYMPLFLDLPVRKVFKRIELGVRISCASDEPMWSFLKGVDPKYIYREGKFEHRSFCCCREGEVLEGSYAGLVTCSGRADCPKTGESNIGFNLRVYDPKYYSMFYEMVQELRRSKLKTYELSFEEFALRAEGNILEKQLLVGLIRFLEFVNIDPKKIKVRGPTIEGIGYYWPVDNNLKIPNENIWVPGDSSGIFRGWTASAVSGYYVAEQIMDTKRGIIKNQILDDINYSQTYPRMVGMNGMKALQEIHIFLEPINPGPEDVEKFNMLVERYNKTRKHEKKMKACHLALEFTVPLETIRVLQSSRYYLSDDMDEVVEQCHLDAQYFAENGFNVIREKIEATVHGTEGVPATDEEMQLYPTKYFEFHIRMLGAEENLEAIAACSKELSKKFGVPIPFSYNKSKGEDGMHQKYLNVRFRHIGSIEANRRVQEIKVGIESIPGMRVDKIISEFVGYDSYPDLDVGWIDKLPNVGWNF